MLLIYLLQPTPPSTAYHLTAYGNRPVAMIPSTMPGAQVHVTTNTTFEFIEKASKRIPTFIILTTSKKGPFIATLFCKGTSYLHLKCRSPKDY